VKITVALLPMLIFLAAFFYAPFIVLAYESFLGINGGYTLSNYLAVFTDPTYGKVIARSLLLAVETTLLTLLLAYPAAYYIALQAGKKEKIILLALIITPFWVDVLLRSIAIKILITALGGKEGYTAMLLGMVYDYLPIMFLPLYASMSRIQSNVVGAARTLGASKLSLTYRIILPLTLPGIVAGSLLVMLMAVTEYVIPALLGGTQGFTVGTLIYYLFLSGGMWGVGAALTIMITIVLMAVAFIIARRLGEEWLV